MADIIENALENTLLANSSGVDVFADESEEDKVSSPLTNIYSLPPDSCKIRID